MSWPFRNKDKYECEDISNDCEPELSTEEITEIVVKDTQIRLKDLETHLKVIIDSLPNIADLKAEIKELKSLYREQVKFNQEIIMKFVDKPAAPSATAAYLANKAAEKGGFAAVDKAANKN